MAAKKTGVCLLTAALALVAGPKQDAAARVSPLTAIEQQVQKPNMLFLFDTSGSMMLVPGQAPADFYEAGMDCDRGDAYCRQLGTPGRCYFSAAGKWGQGIQRDLSSCTSDNHCAVSYCYPVNGGNDYPKYCTSNADCSNVAGDTCIANLCKGTTVNTTCTSNSDCASGYCRRYANDFCVVGPGMSDKIKMCRISHNMCRTDADCVAVPGDTCGPASSRLVLAKSAVKRVINEFYDSVNFGFMTFRQKNYFPYYEATGAITYSTRETFIPKAQLQFAGCFSSTTGPAATCTLSGTTYTRKVGNDSRYRLNKGAYFESTDTSWKAGCSDDCVIDNVGTGIYEGTYYTYSFATAGVGSRKNFSDFTGRVRTDSGKTYVYFDASVTKRNADNVHGKRPSIGDPVGSENCGQWDPARVPFMDTSLTLAQANARNMAQKITAQLEKVSLGGLYPQGGTPSGCSLKNDGTPDRENSAYHYLEYVKQDNATNGVACRPNAVLFVTDGAPGGPECLHADCAMSPPGPGCTCSAVVSARAIYSQLGAKVYTVGFSAEVAGTEDVAKLNNIARAGGTESAYFGTREEELYQALTDAIYDAIKGSYSTSPVSIGAADSGGASTTILDSRADFPSWRGHLIAYDVSVTPPAVKWDVTSHFDPDVDPDFWKKRNVWTSDGATPVKIQVDGAGNITNAADLRALGLGVTEAEAALVARWMLGDPALGNPAIPGAFVNSTPTEVKVPGGSLVYVGASDGMLHAFFSNDQNIGGIDYYGGQEAFAYVPQDMLPVIRRLFAEGGQRPSPAEHVFGLANSPKVKRICTSNCDQAGHQVWTYVLVMPLGFGGHEIFALDITNPFDGTGVKKTTAPFGLLWHTEHDVSDIDRAKYDAALGRTISLPGFYYGKTSDRTEYRLIYGSGYTDVSNSSVGLQIVTAMAATGAVQGTPVSTVGQGATCSLPKVDPTEPTLLADVAIARRFGTNDTDRIGAGYVGDTWGNLFRWVPTTDSEGVIAGAQGTLSVVDTFSCNHPLHLAPTIVQLDRTDGTKSPGAIFLAQLTNSAFDRRTSAQSASFPASQLIIRKDIAQAGHVVAPDTSWGDAQGRIVLSTSNPTEICAVGTSQNCTTAMPSGARPIGSSTGLLRDDGEGFALVTIWYVPDPNGCSKGQSFLTIHEVEVGGSVTQIHGEQVGNEPVIGAVFVGGKLMVVREDGPVQVTAPGLGAVAGVGGPAANGVSLVDRFRRLNWVELP